MFNGKNIQVKDRFTKSEANTSMPFEVLSSGKNAQYSTLKLLFTWKIHPTFIIARLEKYRRKNPKRQVIEIEADDRGWKMESIIASGPSDDDPRKQVYLVI